MTTIAEHSATVLPFKDALLRAPKQRAPRRATQRDRIPTGALPDNVIVLARFARRARSAHRRSLAGRPAGRRGGLMLVVIVTDNGFAAEAIRRSFRGTSGVRVAGYVDGRRPCGAAVAEAGADVVIVDEMTWSANAVARIAEVRRAVPGAKIIVLTAEPDADWLGDAVRAGADAAIAKTVQPATLGLLVREIWAGTIHHAFTTRRATGAATPTHGKLTPRELEILQLVAGGASNGLIARQLWVTEQTVKFHLSNVYRKLGVANRTEAGHYAHVTQPGRPRAPTSSRVADRRAA